MIRNEQLRAYSPYLTLSETWIRNASGLLTPLPNPKTPMRAPPWQERAQGVGAIVTALTASVALVISIAALILQTRSATDQAAITSITAQTEDERYARRVSWWTDFATGNQRTQIYLQNRSSVPIYAVRLRTRISFYGVGREEISILGDDVAVEDGVATTHGFTAASIPPCTLLIVSLAEVAAMFHATGRFGIAESGRDRAQDGLYFSDSVAGWRVFNGELQRQEERNTSRAGYYYMIDVELLGPALQVQPATDCGSD